MLQRVAAYRVARTGHMAFGAYRRYRRLRRRDASGDAPDPAEWQAAHDHEATDPITDNVRHGPTIDVREYAVDGTRNVEGDDRRGADDGVRDDEPGTTGDHA